MIPSWREEKTPLPKKIRGEAIGKRWKGPSLEKGMDLFYFMVSNFFLAISA
jgi:hypothetical protein